MKKVIVACSVIFFSFLQGGDYVWNLKIAMEADITPFHGGLPQDYETYPPMLLVNPKAYVHRITEGDIVWVQTFQVERFCRDVLPYIATQFILVISDGDDSFPSYYRGRIDIDRVIEDPRIIHIFAQNVDEKHPKVTCIPIGMDFHSISHTGGHFGEPSQSVREQERILEEIVGTLKPTYERKKRMLVEFRSTENNSKFGESRNSIFNRVYANGVIDPLDSLVPRTTLWKMRGEYAFSLSRHGNGLDCHRTWEDLMLGCIVIVKTSPIDCLYEGLPVVIVNDWSEVTEENLSLWLEQYQDAFTNPEYRKRLTHTYWMQKIRDVQKRVIR